MSDSENYETTFNHFLLHFLRYLCNFCPNTCSQVAKLMKGSHLGVVTLQVCTGLARTSLASYLAKVQESVLSMASMHEPELTRS
jgi:hypothetical protein